MRFDKTPKHGVILIRPERNLYYDSNQDKVQHWHQSPTLHHHWYYLHLNVSILVPVSLYRRIRWPQIRVSTLSPAVSLCPSTQRSPGWSVPSSTTMVCPWWKFPCVGVLWSAGHLPTPSSPGTDCHCLDWLQSVLRCEMMTEVILTEKVCVTQLWTVCIQYPPNTPHYPHSCIIVILMEYQDTASSARPVLSF